jgi:hypothetical protein
LWYSKTYVEVLINNVIYMGFIDTVKKLFGADSDTAVNVDTTTADSTVGVADEAASSTEQST